MKKFLLTFVISFLSFVGLSQTVQQNWKVENEGQWSSFYWSVVRADQADAQGRYFYYVYFHSNSYFNTKRDGVHYDKASTFIRNIRIQMSEYHLSSSPTPFNRVTVDIPYFTCDWFYDPNYYVAWFYSSSPYNKFYITFEKASAFDYSIY